MRTIPQRTDFCRMGNQNTVTLYGLHCTPKDIMMVGGIDIPVNFLAVIIAGGNYSSSHGNFQNIQILSALLIIGGCRTIWLTRGQTPVCILIGPRIPGTGNSRAVHFASQFTQQSHQFVGLIPPSKTYGTCNAVSLSHRKKFTHLLQNGRKVCVLCPYPIFPDIRMYMPGNLVPLFFKPFNLCQMSGKHIIRPAIDLRHVLIQTNKPCGPNAWKFPQDILYTIKTILKFIYKNGFSIFAGCHIHIKCKTTSGQTGFHSFTYRLFF